MNRTRPEVKILVVDDREDNLLSIETLLEPKGFFRPESRRPHTRRTLRTLLTKPGWNHLEVRTMRGVLSHLAKPDRD